MHPHKPNPRRTDFGPGLRGAPRDRRHLGTPSGVPRVRPRGLLRLIEEQARLQTLSRIATMVTMPAIGALLVLVGIVMLLAGRLLLLWTGVPYSGVLLGDLAVVAVLMGGVLLGFWVRCARSEGV